MTDGGYQAEGEVVRQLQLEIQNAIDFLTVHEKFTEECLTDETTDKQQKPMYYKVDKL